MTLYEKKVAELIKDVYKPCLKQATIDLFENNILPLIHRETPLHTETLSYVTGLTRRLLEIFNPTFTKDIDALTRLYAALKYWLNDVENTNRILGVSESN